jgi:uncharacterized protein YdaU (DUF1376 family)
VPKDSTKRRPWFPFYVEDFFTDKNVREMDDAEIGLYLRLLAMQWQEGAIPADLERLARILNRPRRAIEKAWTRIGRCFIPHPSEPETLVNPRLEHERTRVDEQYTKRAKASIVANAARWKGGERKISTAEASAAAQDSTIRIGSKSESDSHPIRIENASDSDANQMRLASESVPIHIHNSSPIGEPAPNGAECLPLDCSAEERNQPAHASARTFSPENEPVSSPKKTSERKPRQLSLDDRAAYQILDVAWPVISQHHGDDLAITQSDWRKRNKAAALSLHRAGISSEQVLHALTFAFTHTTAAARYGQMVMLSKLQEIMPALRRLKSGEDGAFPARQHSERASAGRIR